MRTLPGQWAVVLSAGAAVAVSLFLLVSSPYATTAAQIAPEGLARAVEEGRRGFLAVNGLSALAVLVLPVLIAGFPLLFRSRRAALPSRAVSSGLLSLLVLLGAMSVGVLLLPSAVLMAVATLILATRREVLAEAEP